MSDTNTTTGWSALVKISGIAAICFLIHSCMAISHQSDVNRLKHQENSQALESGRTPPHRLHDDALENQFEKYFTE